MNLHRSAAAAVLAAFALTTYATTTTVVDLPSRGFVQRILYLRADAPVANILFIPGGSGYLGIQNDGALSTMEAFCGPISRYRQAYADSGYSVALVDSSTDGSVNDPVDIGNVIRYMQGKDNVPTWVIGISNGSIGVVYTALFLPADVIAGFIAMSPNDFPAAQVNAIKRATMVVYHKQDGGQSGPALFAKLTSAPAKELVGMTGGKPKNGCPGYHTFDGLDEELKAVLTGLMTKYASALVPPASTKALAVEFYNASLDHYFISDRADEIAKLDAGTQIKGWTRTGESFNVFTAAGAGTSPVCRFYIPPDKGNSHYYGRSVAECDSTATKNPSFVNEDPQFFHVILPTLGVCPAGTTVVYRVFSERADANHRYTTSRATRDHMVALRWTAEGDGPDYVVMCSPN